jgi:hypothetical protein
MSEAPLFHHDHRCPKTTGPVIRAPKLLNPWRQPFLARANGVGKLRQFGSHGFLREWTSTATEHR